VYNRSSGSPDAVVKRSRRSFASFGGDFVSDIRQRTLRARINCVMEKKPNSAATQTASAISQGDTSRVDARTAELIQPNAKTANTAPVTS
jgi:hypothetical protein